MAARWCALTTVLGVADSVVTLVISHSNHSPAMSDVAFNHYSMLATIEDGWRLGCLAFTCDTANVQPMSDLVGPRG